MSFLHIANSFIFEEKRMNHGIYNFVGVVLILLLVCSGCRGLKVSSRNKTEASRTERVERSVESARTTELEEQRTEHRGSKAERVFSRVIEYDTTGSIQRVSETWRDRRLSNVSAEERTARVVSITNSDELVSQKDTAHAIITETSHTKTDSRPVQGFEWFWVILSSVLIIAGILIFTTKRK